MATETNLPRTIVDNWQLELAYRVIESSLVFTYPLRVDESNNFQDYNISTQHKMHYVLFDKDASNAFTAMFELLDLLVCNDELVYDAEMAWTWNKSEIMKPIAPLMTQVRLGKRTREIITDSLHHTKNDSSPKIIWEGAQYYLGLSRLLGISYWPSPERARYLANTWFEQNDRGFIVLAKEIANAAVFKTLSDLFQTIDLGNHALAFPGFGSAILSNCLRRESILPTAIEFRDTRECVAFRSWLHNMNIALQSGDTMIVMKGLKDIKDVMVDISATLGLTSQTRKDVELQLGISPTITIGTELIKSIYKKFLPRPYHLVFLRQHYERVLWHSMHELGFLFPMLTIRRPCYRS